MRLRWCPTPLSFLARRDPTVPPPPDLSDGTPVYTYAVIWTSDHCPSLMRMFSDDPGYLLMILCHVSDVLAQGPPLAFKLPDPGGL